MDMKLVLNGVLMHNDQDKD